MKDMTTSEFGVKTTHIRYTNGTSTTSEEVIRKSTVSVTGGQIRHGDRHAPLAWSYRVSRVVNLNGGMVYNRPGSVRRDSGTLSTSTGLTSTVIETKIGLAEVRARTTAMDSLYENLRQNTDIGSSIGEAYGNRFKANARELDRTAAEAERKAQRAYARANGAKKRRERGTVVRSVRHRHKATDYLAEAWLSMRYKWMPIVSDTFAIAQEASGNMTRKGFVIKASGGSSETFEPITLSINSILFRNAAISGQASVSCRGKFRFVVNPTADMVARLTSLDPAVIAWNMIPYSFVVDWFLNVGGYLRDLETRAMYASAFKGGYLTTRTRVSAGVSHSGRSDDGTVFVQCSSSVEHKRASRVLYSNLPSPNVPKPKIDLGSGTLLNAAALLRKRLKLY